MSDPPLEILVVADGFPPDVGGWEVYNGEYSRRLRERGHRVEVFTWRARLPRAVTADARSDIPVHLAPRRRRGRSLDISGLGEVLDRRRPDVAFVSGGSKSLVAAIETAARRVPVVVSVHDLRDEGRGRGPAARWWFRRRYGFHRAAHLTANSRDTRGRILDFGVPPEKVSVVYPGVDTSVFAPDEAAGERARQELGLRGRKVLLTVAGLRRVKGHGHVIDALPALRRRIPGLAYVIVGGGKLRQELERRAAERGVSELVHFAGKVPDARPYFHACDVFVMVSVPRGDRARAGEGFGIAYAEAGACGKPVVASTSGGACEIVVDGETGRLLAPDDAAGLEQALFELLSDPERARLLGERARRRVERFDWDHGACELERLLRAAASRACASSPRRASTRRRPSA